jgi:hypothetical protein
MRKKTPRKIGAVKKAVRGSNVPNMMQPARKPVKKAVRGSNVPNMMQPAPKPGQVLIFGGNAGPKQKKKVKRK